MSASEITEVLKFWFGNDLSNLKEPSYKHKPELWFKLKYETDELIRQKYSSLLKKAEENNLIDWESTTQGCLALIIILDQFSRNIYRGTSDMFKNDTQALKISLNLIKNKPDQVKNLSLIEQFFIYLPLLHTEDLDLAKKSLDLIQNLALNSPDQQKANFMKYYVSSKNHYDLLLKFNRYPHRNFLLNRKSNEEELQFLNRSKHNFVKSVQPISKPSNYQNKSKIKNDSLPYQKVLFLHGFRQNSNKLKKRLNFLVKLLQEESNAHVTFLNGTHPYVSNGEIAQQINNSLGSDFLNPIESQRVWFNSDDNAEVYFGIEESISYILEHVKLNGPYDGIIGFGQGALMASITTKLNPNIFRYIINISCFEPRAEKYKNLFSSETKFDFPSLHIYGKNDILINGSRSERFSNCFKNSCIAEHEAGHFSPQAWPIDKMFAFINLHGSNLKPPEFSSKDSFELNIFNLNNSLLRFNIDDINFDNYLGSLNGLEKDLFKFYIDLIKSKKEDENKICQILKQYLDLYLKDDSNKNYLLNEALNLLFIDSNNWKELVLLCDLSFRMEMNDFYFHLIQIFSKQLIKDLSFIDFKSNTYNLQELTKIEPHKFNKEENYTVSNLAKAMPRIKSSIDKRSRIGRECANQLNNYKETMPENLKKSKIHSYNHHRKIVSLISHYIDTSKSNIENSNPRKFFNLSKHDKKVYEYLLKAPLSDAILNPVPEIVDISAQEQLKPLHDWLNLNKNLAFNEQDIKFLRGTVTHDGRLDLCKQVIGPNGIKPLLDSLSENKNIDRLLLGNNIIGDEAGELIAKFIKSGKSELKIWYIAGNNLTSKGIKPICEALENDTQVTALWLKRNPLKSAGMVHLSNLLQHNKTIQVLDLLNCGLLNDGVRILFESLGSNKSLKHLYLSANGITSEGLEHISRYYESNESQLETLFLGCNRIGDSGAKIIADILKKDVNLKRLNLSSSRIGAKGMKYLSEGLLSDNNLEVLDLGYMKATMDLGELGNNIEDEGAFYLSKLLENNKKLKWLNITHNHISQKGMQMIVESIKSFNKSLIILDYVQYGVSLNEITLTELRNCLNENKKTLDSKQIDDILIPEHVKEIYSVYRTH